MPKGLAIRNDRQLSALAAEELREIAASLGVASAAPELVGANILVEGVAGFSRLAPGSHLAIGGDWAGKGKFDGEVILRAEAYNHPCRGPGRKLAAAHGDPALEFAFVKAARSLRGLVLSVAAPGVMRVGDAVVIVPPSLAP
jgi:MOSC domain-containing protein YiiM